MVSETSYYRCSLFLPFILPLLAWVGLLVGIKPGISVTLIGSQMFGTIPYGVFAFSLSHWMLRRNTLAVRRAMYCAPLLFLPFLYLWILAIALASGPAHVLSELPLAVSLTPAALVVGYGYVIPVLLFRVLATRARFVAPA